MNQLVLPVENFKNAFLDGDISFVKGYVIVYSGGLELIWRSTRSQILSNRFILPLTLSSTLNLDGISSQTG